MKVCDRCREPASCTLKVNKQTIDLCQKCFDDVYSAISKVIGMTPQDIIRAKYDAELSEEEKADIRMILGILNTDGAWHPVSLEDISIAAADAGIADGEAERYLKILIDEGYVVKRPDGTYAGAEFL